MAARPTLRSFHERQHGKREKRYVFNTEYSVSILKQPEEAVPFLSYLKTQFGNPDAYVVMLVSERCPRW